MGRSVAEGVSLIDADRLQRLAREAGVRPPVWVAETTSTQDAVRTWARAQQPEGMALVADRQTEGRGRLGRRWEAPAGTSLLMSVLLRPQVPPSRVGLVPLAAAVAVRMATRARVQIKWPNDLLTHDGAKVGGLLAEAEVGRAGVDWVVLGVGLNVVMPPPGVANAACLDDLGPRMRREDLAVDVVKNLLRWTRVLEEAPERVLRAWRHGSGMLGRTVRVAGRTGTALDVAEDGALTLRTEDGTIERIVTGDVELVTLHGDDT